MVLVIKLYLPNFGEVIMKIVRALIFISFLSCFACENRQDPAVVMEERSDGINSIIIEFYPSYHEPSIAILNLKDEIVVFKRIGQKSFFRPQKHAVIDEITAIRSVHFKLDSCVSQFWKDSIWFTEEDFTDQEKDVLDGIFNTILYIFENGNIHDVDLNNSITPNQHKLIVMLIDETIPQTSDSLTENYFRKLREYYERPDFD